MKFHTIAFEDFRKLKKKIKLNFENKFLKKPKISKFMNSEISKNLSMQLKDENVFF